MSCLVGTAGMAVFLDMDMDDSIRINIDESFSETEKNSGWKSLPSSTLNNYQSIRTFLFRWKPLINGITEHNLFRVNGVYIVEHCQKAHRMLISNIVTWSPNFALAPIIAYYAEDWRTLSYYSTIINIVAILVLAWVYEALVINKNSLDQILT